MAAGLNGKLATHSLRKSFAQRVYEQSDDIYLVQEMLGHRTPEHRDDTEIFGGQLCRSPCFLQRGNLMTAQWKTEKNKFIEKKNAITIAQAVKKHLDVLEDDPQSQKRWV